jgi:hypothetical protein
VKREESRKRISDGPFIVRSLGKEWCGGFYQRLEMVFPLRYGVILECIVAIPNVVPDVVFVQPRGEALESEVVHAEGSKLALNHNLVEMLAPQDEAADSSVSLTPLNIPGPDSQSCRAVYEFNPVLLHNLNERSASLSNIIAKHVALKVHGYRA